MSSLDDVLRIEEFEAALARGESPKSALEPLMGGDGPRNLAWAFQIYLLFATDDQPRRGPMKDLDDELLLAAFKAAVRQIRVDKKDVGKLHLKAEAEATNARFALAEAEENFEKADELAEARARLIDERDDHIFRLQNELLSVRGKYARSVQTINQLKAKLNEPTDRDS